MLAVLSLLLIFGLSLLIVHIGTVALMMTGMSRQSAEFSALSAFSRAGIPPPGKVDDLTNHPARVKIVSLLIRLGSVGFVSITATAIVGLNNADAGTGWTRLLLVGLGVVFLFGFARSALFDRLLTPLVRRLLDKTTELRSYDFTNLLHLSNGDYKVTEITVSAGSYLANDKLRNLDIFSEGILVLGIFRGEAYLGAPQGDTQFEEGDRVVLYGHRKVVDDLARRRAGDRAAHNRGKQVNAEAERRDSAE